MAEIGLDGDSLSLRAGRVALRRLEPVVITARDGLLLNGYLTRPAAAVGNPPPLLLAIHGGPSA
jgi:dipeptidyl aminopeptidase/acylaminoacyl peptidase